MKVAVPWSLSHYIILNGFHPLYRALFDHAPPDIEINAWDNVKLHQRFDSDVLARRAAIEAALQAGHDASLLDLKSLDREHQEYFGPSNRALTDALPGEIEFHHTAPYPSLSRPFIFHCESFAPVFLPFAEQGGGGLGRRAELQRYYRQIFAHPLCLGIHSHLPETLESLSTFFSDTAVDSKLMSSRIGLSQKSVDPTLFRETAELDRPRFLFINSAHQNPDNFFKRGGHIVLNFWKEYRSAQREGQLILRCSRPSNEQLKAKGVDASFVEAEIGHSIIWAEDYLANHEINALMASSHFFLLPSLSLHSASLLLAMTLGAVPVVTDTLGVSNYAIDGDNAVVLTGVRDEIWHRDPETGILIDSYKPTPRLDQSLAEQTVQKIFALLDSPEAYRALRRRMVDRVQRQYSGEDFAAAFWEATSVSLERSRRSEGTSAGATAMGRSLSNCIVDQSDWSRVFESMPQPMRRIRTTYGSIWELGGAMVHIAGHPVVSLQHWSVLSKYLGDGPETTFANDLVEFQSKTLSPPAGAVVQRIGEGKVRRRISLLLMPYPKIHSVAAALYKRTRTARIILVLWRRSWQYQLGISKGAPDIELVAEGIRGYNVIRYFHLYYAILQSEGAFDRKRIRKRGYSSIFCTYSAKRTLRQIVEATSMTRDSPPGWRRFLMRRSTFK